MQLIVIGLVYGITMRNLGVDILSWQWWIIIICIAAAYIVGLTDY